MTNSERVVVWPLIVGVPLWGVSIALPIPALQFMAGLCLIPLIVVMVIGLAEGALQFLCWLARHLKLVK